LTDDEISWLTQLREEEKAARDVYLTIYDKYKLRIFKNIATSEQAYMDAIKKLRDTYSVPCPATGRGIGQFTKGWFTFLSPVIIPIIGRSVTWSTIRAGTCFTRCYEIS